jgi:PAS domain S-box-containing protein
MNPVIYIKPSSTFLVIITMGSKEAILLMILICGIFGMICRKLFRLKSQAMARLAAENKMLLTILDSIPDPVIAINDVERTALLNKSAKKLTGLRKPRHISPSELYINIQSGNLEGVPKDLSGNTNVDVDVYTTNSGEQLRNFQRSVISIRSRNNNFSGTLIHYKDVTAYAAQSQHSQSIATRYSNAFNNSPAAMAVIRIADGKILDCNSSFETFLGFSKPELSSSTLSSRTIFQSSAQLMEILHYVRDNRKLYNIELALQNSGNETIFALGSFEGLESESEYCVFATFIDITEWKKTEQALIDSENFAYAALDSLASQIAILDECAVLVYTNTAWKNSCANTFGQESCYIHGTDLIMEWQNSDSTSPEITALFTEGMNKVLSSENSCCFEFRNTTGNTTEWYSCRISKFRHGIYVRILISIDNISNLKKAEQEREHSELKFKSIFENSTEGIFQSNAEGTLITVNPAMAAIFGFATPERFLNTFPKLSRLMGIHSAEEENFLENLKSTHPWKGIEFTTVGSGGSIIQLLMKARHIYDLDGKVNFIEGNIEDITERKTAETALRNSESTLRTIFDNTIQSFVLLDQDLRIIKWNSKAASEIKSITGLVLKKEDSVSRFIPKKYSTDFASMIHDAYSGKSLNRQIKVREINGSIKWMQVNLCSYQSDAGVQGVILSGTDITLDKLSEEKFNNQMTMLQKTNHELDRFVYSVSHDLRAPLTSILGVISIATFESTSPVMQKHLEMIAACVNRLDGFIQDILNYSRNTRQELKCETVNFRQLLTEARSNLKFMKAETRIRIKGEISDFTPFHSDVTRISTILNNLLSNAIKYSDKSKSDPYIEVSITTESSRCMIVIADNGIGIHSDHQNKIFEMFYRVSHTVSGSGLGLYIVKETVNKLKGTIHVVSSPGEGSIFTISLPELTDSLKNYKRDEIEN